MCTVHMCTVKLAISKHPWQLKVSAKNRALLKKVVLFGWDHDKVSAHRRCPLMGGISISNGFNCTVQSRKEKFVIQKRSLFFYKYTHSFYFTSLAEHKPIDAPPTEGTDSSKNVCLIVRNPVFILL